MDLRMEGFFVLPDEPSRCVALSLRSRQPHVTKNLGWGREAGEDLQGKHASWSLVNEIGSLTYIVHWMWPYFTQCRQIIHTFGASVIGTLYKPRNYIITSAISGDAPTIEYQKLTTWISWLLFLLDSYIYIMIYIQVTGHVDFGAVFVHRKR